MNQGECCKCGHEFVEGEGRYTTDNFTQVCIPCHDIQHLDFAEFQVVAKSNKGQNIYKGSGCLLNKNKLKGFDKISRYYSQGYLDDFIAEHLKRCKILGFTLMIDAIAHDTIKIVIGKSEKVTQ